jgi:hypothetical protein
MHHQPPKHYPPLQPTQHEPKPHLATAHVSSPHIPSPNLFPFLSLLPNSHMLHTLTTVLTHMCIRHECSSCMPYTPLTNPLNISNTSFTHHLHTVHSHHTHLHTTSTILYTLHIPPLTLAHPYVHPSPTSLSLASLH